MAGEDDRGPDDVGDLVQAAPGLARLAAGMWWRTATWSVGASVRASSRVVRAASSGESAGQLLHELEANGREYARRVLGVVPVPSGAYGRPAGPPAGDPDPGAEPAAREVERERVERVDRGQRAARNQARGVSLRERGAALLRQSADVRYEEELHPAYERMLDELAPDEGRLLRFLYLNGPQPSVDVRASKALDVRSQMVAPGVNMVGAEAGCRYVERVPAYMNNLYRLGLIWFSREPLEDRLRYQVLEAQPEVTAALRKGGRGRTVRRSIHLTPFGEDFCRAVLPMDTEELEALSGPSDVGSGPSDGGPAV